MILAMSVLQGPVLADDEDYCVTSRTVIGDTGKSELYKVWDIPHLNKPLLLYSPSWTSNVLERDLSTTAFSPPSPFPSGPLGLAKYVVETSGRVVGISGHGLYSLSEGDAIFKEISAGPEKNFHKVVHLPLTGETLIVMNREWYLLDGEALLAWPVWQELKAAGVTEILAPVWLPGMNGYILQTKERSFWGKDKSSIYVKIGAQPVRHIYDLEQFSVGMYLGVSSMTFSENASGSEVIGASKNEGFVFNPASEGKAQLLFLQNKPAYTVGFIDTGRSELHDTFLLFSDDRLVLPTTERSQSALKYYVDGHLEDVPGDIIRRGQFGGAFAVDLRTIGKTAIWARGGLWLYDGSRVQHVAGSEKLHFMDDFIEFTGADSVLLLGRGGFFELSREGKLSPLGTPFQTQFGENGTSPELVFWQAENEAVFFTQQGIFVMNEAREFRKLSEQIIHPRSNFVSDPLEFPADRAIVVRASPLGQDRFIRISKGQQESELPCGYWTAD